MVYCCYPGHVRSGTEDAEIEKRKYNSNQKKHAQAKERGIDCTALFHFTLPDSCVSTLTAC
eukprot:3606640-Amphidinium_carterae.1